MKKTVHLVSNAHLDPVWLWQWEEGVAETLSTFRTAADLCEEFPEFVFNHNEAVLYEWVEENEPELFKRIRKLVKAGRWHVMGGWFLQPDMNMPQGESIVRQITWGRDYFKKKLGVEPTTAINFDPFGNSRGLVQILTKSGYDSYLFGRPTEMKLPSNPFRWVGYDGSEVLAARIDGWYNSSLGKAANKVKQLLEKHADQPLQLILWGVGDHGGGPSRQDLKDLRKLGRDLRGARLVHSTPEDYLAAARKSGAELGVLKRDLNSWAPGCYSSMALIKQKHRRLESELYATEKMASTAALAGRMEYPRDALRAALKDLLFCEFHDILPGSCIQPAEQDALRRLDHGLEEVSRAKTQIFMTMARGEPKPAPGEYAIFVHNPHPYPVTTVVEAELQRMDIDFEKDFIQKVFTLPVLSQNGGPIASQPEKELCNLNLDWRRRVAFRAELAPGRINRFDCRFERLPAKPALNVPAANGLLRVAGPAMEAAVSTRTGLLETLRINGRDMVAPGAFRLLVIADDSDCWGGFVMSFPKTAGEFRLMTPEENGRFCGLGARPVPAVRVIEDGAVRTLIEANFIYDHSMVCLRYKLPKQGAELEVEARVFWQEKDRMLKLAVPLPDGDYEFLGDDMFGIKPLAADGNEQVAQKWTAARERASGRLLALVNDGVYGADVQGREWRTTLLRSPAFATGEDKAYPSLPQDRFTPRQEQGERVFRFWMTGGETAELLPRLGRLGQTHNEPPMVLSFFPNSHGQPAQPALEVDGAGVVVSAFKQAEDGRGYIVRLYNAQELPTTAQVRLPGLRLQQSLDVGAFEIRTLYVDPVRRTLRETDLLERALKKAGPAKRRKK